MPGFELIGEEEKKAVIEVFEKSGGVFFAHGFDAKRNNIFRVREFEKEFSEKLGVSHAQAVSSGTAALKCALKALGVGPGDEVITQSFTFVATVEAILDCGATPVITEIDASYNMCADSLRECISEKTKVIIPVHMAGAVADMEAILAVAKENNVIVLEDTAQGLGGKYQGKSLGTLGHVGCFSFDYGKVMTTGEGGMVVTNDKELYQTIRGYHDHGHEYNLSISRGAEGAICAGFNYRMTDIEAAIGREQLKKLDTIKTRQLANKTFLKTILESELSEVVQFRKIYDPEGDVGDTLMIAFDTEEQAASVAKELQEKGVGTKNVPDALNWHFAGNWKQLFEGNPHYDTDKLLEAWPKSHDLLSRSIAIPIMINKTEEELSQAAEIILSAVKQTV